MNKFLQPTKLTAPRAVLVYALAFLLLLLLDADRFTGLLEQAEAPASISEGLHTVAERTGATALSRLEHSVLEALHSDRTLAESRPENLPRAANEDTSENVSRSGTEEPSAAGESETADANDTNLAVQLAPQSGSLTGNDTVTATVLDNSSKNETGAAETGTKIADSKTAADTVKPISVQNSGRPEAPTRTPAHPKTEDTSSAITASTSAAASPESSSPAVQRRQKVLIAGDSMVMGGMGPQLQRMLAKRQDLTVIRKGQYSTGLSRPDYYDWPARMQELVAEHDPDVIVICLGANDPQDILDEKKKRHHADAESWRTIYRNRAENLLRIACSRGARAVWAGLPIMGKEPYNKRIRRISGLQQEACTLVPTAVFVDTYASLADKDGNYTTYALENGQHTRLRLKDKIHVSDFGGKILARTILPAVEQQLSQGRTNSTKPGGPDEKSPILLTETAHTEERTFFSRARNKTVSFLAFVPEFSRAEERLPVICLLHGAYENGDVWKREAEQELLKLASQYRVIFVAPSCEPFGWYVDSPLVAGNNIESFLMQEFFPHVERMLPVNGRKSLLGISMGGYGAIRLGLLHADEFASLSSLSGVLDLGRHAGQWQIETLLGPAKSWQKFEIASLPVFRSHQNTPLPPILITTGAQDDIVLQENREFRSLLRQNKANYEYHEGFGTHDWNFWRGELPQHAAFHASCLFTSPSGQSPESAPPVR